MVTAAPPTSRGSRPGRRRALPFIAIGVALLVLVVGAVVALAAYRRLSGAPPPLSTNSQDPAPALEASADPARGDIRFVLSGEVVAGPTAEVAVQAPPGATEMQVGLDPTFATTPWQPVAASVSIAVPDVGYQMLFGRFRSGPAADPSAVSVDGLTVDPTYEAATASATGLHRASWVRPLSPSAVMVRIEAGRIAQGRQEAYDFDSPPAGDDVSGLFGPKTVSRDGEPYGRQVAGRDDLVRSYDRLIGRPLPVDGLDGGQWTISSPDDDAFAAGVSPVAIERISRPAGNGLGPGAERFTPLVHDVVLQLTAPLQPGVRYVVAPPTDLVEPIELVVDPVRTISPAVHVNQNGYRPDDALKVGYVAGVPGDPGTAELGGGGGTESLPFRVISAATDEVVERGTTTRRPGGDELGRGDLTGAAVHEIDFSALDEPGRYRVCVDTVGCSVDFTLDRLVWDELTVAVARAMYHQRSGVALGPPYTSVTRPRPYHPDDGLVVTESTFRLLDAEADVEQVFSGLVEGKRETVVPEAWGGHFDAGDWDRRIQHLFYTRAVIELVDQHPERFGDVSIQIPESGDVVPDLLDDGLWTLDLFQRLQRPDGSIPGGIEASEHPQPDTTSWSDSLAVFTYAPDPFATYVYTGVAAQAATVLARYDEARADGYLDSALAAMAWAEGQPIEADPETAAGVRAHRSVAAVALYEATGDARWHDVFVESTTFTDGVDSFLSCHEHSRCDAGWIYLGIDQTATDPALRSTIEQSFVATADEILAAADTTSFGWAVENRFVPLIWGLGPGGAPNAVGLLRAWDVTGDRRYLAGAQRAAAVSLGANPTNTVFVTGVGREPVRHPLIVDYLNGGLPVWPGTPVYGYHTVVDRPEDAWVTEVVLEPAGVDPLPAELPYLWQWFDVPDVAMYNEYTVHQSHGAAIEAFGLLAAAEG